MVKGTSSGIAEESTGVERVEVRYYRAT
jgi:hypothetical protein